MQPREPKQARLWRSMPLQSERWSHLYSLMWKGAYVLANGIKKQGINNGIIAILIGGGSGLEVDYFD